MTDGTRKPAPPELIALLWRFAQLGQLLPKLDEFHEHLDEAKLVMAEMDRVRREIYARAGVPYDAEV